MSAACRIGCGGFRQQPLGAAQIYLGGCLENLAFSDEKNVIDSLQIYFAIMKNILKIKQENVLINLENFIIKLIFISESDISDDFSMNICSSKQLHSAVIDKDSIFNSSADNTLIITMSKS